MKKQLFTFVLVALSGQVFSQCLPPTAEELLEINNAKTLVKNNGTIWPHVSSELPANAVHSLWVGGIDVNGQAKIAAMRYGAVGNDYFTGPLNFVTASTEADNCAAYDRIWKIEKWQVDEFKARLNQPGYSIPDVILNWPAHGDASLNQFPNLATYYDADGSGYYNPLDGDFPYYNQDTVPNLEHRRMMLKGDQTLWWVMNDIGDIHTESGGNPIGLEIRCMAYGFNTCGPLANVTFYEYEIINVGSYTLEDSYVGVWADADAGSALDDRVQCDVARNLGFAFDPPSTNGSATHAVGINLLNGPYMNPDGMDNDGDGIPDNEQILMTRFNTSPDSINGSAQFSYILRGKLSNGTPLCYGGNGEASGGCNGTTAHFMFPGDSDPTGIGTNGVPQAPWFDNNPDAVPFDRRFVMSAGPFILEPGAVHSFQYAVVMATEEDGSDPIPQLLSTSDLARSVFDSSFFNMPCCAPSAAIALQRPETFRFLFSSIAEGESYLWDFGDGQTSTERFPFHVYTEYGGYEVCLTVTNACGTDTQCQNVEIEVGSTGIEEQITASSLLSIAPNPSTAGFQLTLSKGVMQSVRLFDTMGKMVLMQTFAVGTAAASISTIGIASGMYLAHVQTGKGVAVQRVVIQ